MKTIKAKAPNLCTTLIISCMMSLILFCPVSYVYGEDAVSPILNNEKEVLSNEAESPFDSGDDPFDNLSSFDSGVNPAPPEMSQKPEISKPKCDEDLMDKLRNSSRFTLGYELSFGTASRPDLIANNLYIRQETQGLFYKNLFFKFDGRVLLLPENDHRAEARDKELVLEEHLREFYLQAGFDNFSVRFGRQIVVWGKADAAIITDVVSARDNSDFIFIKLEDSRVGQMMLSTDIYTTLGNIFLFISPEPPTDIEPDKGTRYYRQFPGTEEFVVTEKASSFSDIEYGTRWARSFEKTDLSFMAGRFFSNRAIYVSDLSRISGLSPDFFTLSSDKLESDAKSFDKFFFDAQSGQTSINEVVNHTVKPFKMAGIAASHARENILFKVESAFKRDFPLQGMDENQNYIAEAKDLLDLSLGVEYNANDRYHLSFELSHRYITGKLNHLPFDDRNSTASYFTFTKEYLNQTLEFEYMLYHHIQERNTFHHFRLTRDVTDNFQIIGSLAFFNIQDEASNLWYYKDEDRISVEMRYYF